MNEYMIFYRTKDEELVYNWWNGSTLESAIDSASYDLQNNGEVDVERTLAENAEKPKQKKQTARQYAKECGVEVIGKLKRKYYEYKEYDSLIGEMVIKKESYYMDDAGNEFHYEKGYWCIIASDGTIY